MTLLCAHKAAVLPLSIIIIFNVRTIKQLSSLCAGDFTRATELWEVIW
jgi:hypothetical protein